MPLSCTIPAMRVAVVPQLILVTHDQLRWLHDAKPNNYVKAFRQLQADEVMILQYGHGDLSGRPGDDTNYRQNVYEHLRRLFPQRDIHTHLDRPTNNIWVYWAGTPGLDRGLDDYTRNRPLVVEGIKAGRIVMPKSCLRCTKVEKLKPYWQDPVEQPLWVNWLCESCHAIVETKFGSGTRVRT